MSTQAFSSLETPKSLTTEATEEHRELLKNLFDEPWKVAPLSAGAGHEEYAVGDQGCDDLIPWDRGGIEVGSMQLSPLDFGIEGKLKIFETKRNGVSRGKEGKNSPQMNAE